MKLPMLISATIFSRHFYVLIRAQVASIAFFIRPYILYTRSDGVTFRHRSFSRLVYSEQKCNVVKITAFVKELQQMTIMSLKNKINKSNFIANTS